jgi:hypothetical protein
MAGPNPIPANRLSAAERNGEIAEILAVGVMRLRARKSSPLSRESGESLLDCTAYQSGHANTLNTPGGLD